jgi:hypothetical protein
LTKEAKMIEEVLLRWEWQPREDAVLVEKAWLKGVYPHFEGKVFFSIMLWNEKYSGRETSKLARNKRD